MASSIVLPSWTDGETRAVILHFVRRVTNHRSPDYVPPEDRVAVLKSDGSLWCERPAPALAFFVMHALRDVNGHSRPRERLDADLICAARAGDLRPFQRLAPRALAEIVLRLEQGRTPEEFIGQAHRFLRDARHPRFGVPFGQLTYRPMLELLRLLQANQFRAFVLTAGSVEFLRAASEGLYGVPRERVVGPTVDYACARLDGRLLLTRTRTLLGEACEGDGAVRMIQQRIGRRPILAVGSAAGDDVLLEYTRTGSQAGLCVLLEHDDPVREYAYIRSGERLARADRQGWCVVSMRRDFRRVFGRRVEPGHGPRRPIGSLSMSS